MSSRLILMLMLPLTLACIGCSAQNAAKCHAELVGSISLRHGTEEYLHVSLQNPGSEPMMLWIARDDSHSSAVNRPYAYYVGDNTLILYCALVAQPASVHEAFPQENCYAQVMPANGKAVFDISMKELRKRDDTAYGSIYEKSPDEKPNVVIQRVIVVQGYIRANSLEHVDEVDNPATEFKTDAPR